MSDLAGERMVAIAGINGRDYETWELIRDALTQARIEVTSEGSCGVDIIVFEVDAARATEILKKDEHLAMKAIWYLPRPVFVGTAPRQH